MMRLSHVNVTMPKGGEDTARAFYHGLLGLPEIPKPEGVRGRGGVRTEDGRPAPWRRFFTYDPFGNRIEIHEAGVLRA